MLSRDHAEALLWKAFVVECERLRGLEQQRLVMRTGYWSAFFVGLLINDNLPGVDPFDG